MTGTRTGGHPLPVCSRDSACRAKSHAARAIFFRSPQMPGRTRSVRGAWCGRRCGRPAARTRPDDMLQALLEPRVRCLVADTLGVGIDELGVEVSLTDDLAADSLDLAELAARLEADLGLVMPDRVVDHLRTYGDLVRAATAAARERRTALEIGR